jgi:hypothetical protein
MIDPSRYGFGSVLNGRVSSFSTVVLRKTIAAYSARRASVNTAASSVTSTAKPPSCPSARIASTPAGIDAWQ